MSLSFPGEGGQLCWPGEVLYNVYMNRFINNTSEKQKRRELRIKQTPQEVILWSMLRNNKTGYKWRRQVSIGPYIADFYCREKQLVVEIDGSQHIQAREYDLTREKYFNQLGIRTIRFWNNEINTNIEGVYMKIMIELKNKTTPEEISQLPVWKK